VMCNVISTKIRHPW